MKKKRPHDDEELAILLHRVAVYDGAKSGLISVEFDHPNQYRWEGMNVNHREGLRAIARFINRTILPTAIRADRARRKA